MPDLSSDAIAVLGLLKERHNVLISGPPGTGKSLLLSEIARAFETVPSSGPVHVPGADVAIPMNPPTAGVLQSALPSPECTNRKVFRTVFHQNSKYREFLTGLVPVINSSAAGGATFRIVEGILFRASEYARSEGGASLLVIDEINRGPAVQVFGGSIVAIESDKRLAPDGSPKLETQFFEVTSPGTGDLLQYALPHQLYILAAMNQADTSVEPLDVAFLRRWTPFRLDPDEGVLRSYFHLVKELTSAVPEVPTSAAHVHEALVQAWRAVNGRIRVGRGPEFQIGHGVLMARSVAATALDEALLETAQSWNLMRAHVDEVFFGDVRGVAAVLNVGSVGRNPFSLADTTFADEPRLELTGPQTVVSAEIYGLLCAVAG